jgi:uridine kinase
MMAERHSPLAKPDVIVISGSVGSGKSTVSKALAKILGDAPILTFDHYGQFVEWPQDMGQWIKNGANPTHIRVPRLKEDLLALLAGQAVTDPRDGSTISPGRYIILEEPSGRERQEIRDYIDRVVYIDVPQDVCVTRLIERVVDMEVWNAKGTFQDETKQDLVRQLDAVALWMAQYRQGRSMYIQVSQRVHAGADLVVDGSKSVDEITTDIVDFMRCAKINATDANTGI